MTDDPYRARVESLVSFAAGPGGKLITGALARYFRASLVHAERIPRTGAALIVSNHGPFGLDSIVLTSLVLRDTGRYVRFLVERNLARIAPIRSFFNAVAVLPGTKAAALEALGRGDLVGSYPGGIDESLKRTSDRHRLKWGARDGFAKVALRARVPIVPIAGLGIDDIYTIVAREPWIGRRLLGSPRYDLPLTLGAFGTPLPRRTTMRFVVCEPIMPLGEAHDPSAVHALRDTTRAALEHALRS